jgi:hypothetical protein
MFGGAARIAAACSGPRCIEEFRVLDTHSRTASEGEVAEIQRSDVAVLDQIDSRSRISITSECPISELKIASSFTPNGIAAAEGSGIHQVVGLAAEIVGLGVEVGPVFLAGDLVGREIVHILDPRGTKGPLRVRQAPRSRSALAMSS